MQRRKSLEGEKDFNELISDMKVDSIAKLVEEADKRDHVTLELAKKLASSIYFRKKTINSLYLFEKEIRNEIMPRFSLSRMPTKMLTAFKILKSMYNSNIPYVRLVAVNSFDALLDQFITKGGEFQQNKIYEYFYTTILISIYLSGQTLPITDNIHQICLWTYACVGGKAFKDIKYEVETFLKDPIPISDGRVRDMIVQLYETNVTGREILRMLRYTSVYKKASNVKVNRGDFIVPNDILVLTQEYQELMEKFRDRYRYYMDNGSIETIGTIDDFLFKNRIKL